MNSASECGWAVVTGAAGGLGAAFAKRLAARQYRLLLVDRRPAALDQVGDSLAAEFGVHAESQAVDLSNREQVVQLGKRLAAMPDLELLVNNAGFGAVDYFADTDVDYLVGMADVHVVAPTILTRAVLPGMIERNRGNIVNVSSLGSWFHSAGNVQYGATKCYLATMSQSLQQELRGTNVRVQALCPGFVRTGFHAAESMSAFKLRSSPAERMWMSAEDVAECSLRKLNSRQVVVIPGLGYRIVGRLAQMPMLQPLMQWITKCPRSVPANGPGNSRSAQEASAPIERRAESCPEPALSAAKKA